MTHCFI